MKLTNCLLLTHLLFGAYVNSVAQDSSLAHLRNNLISTYTTSLGHDAGLYNGMEYFEYSHTIKESHPFFIKPVYDSSWVIYNGLRYEKVPMIYDLVMDELVIQHATTLVRMQLHKQLVEEFQIETHRFVHLKKDSTNKSLPASGFYEVLYDGKVKLYSRRTKSLTERTTNTDIFKIAVPKDYYYIFRDGNYYSVRNEKALLDVFRQKRSEVAQHLKKNGIRFRRQKENALIEATRIYDQLTR